MTENQVSIEEIANRAIAIMNRRITNERFKII